MTRSRKRRPAFDRNGGRVSLGEAADNDSDAEDSAGNDAAVAESGHEPEHLMSEAHGGDILPEESEAGGARFSAPRPDAGDKHEGIKIVSAAPYLHQPSSSSDAGVTQLPKRRPGRGGRWWAVVVSALVAVAAGVGAGVWLLAPSDTISLAPPGGARIAAPPPIGVATSPSAASIADAKRAELARATGMLALAEQLRREVESGAPIGQTRESIVATGSLSPPVEQALAQLLPLSQGVPTLSDLSQSFQALADQAAVQSALSAPWPTRMMAKLTALIGGGVYNPLSGTVAHLRTLIEDGRTNEVADWVSGSGWATTGSDWINLARARASAVSAAQTITTHAQKIYDAAAAAVAGNS